MSYQKSDEHWPLSVSWKKKLEIVSILNVGDMVTEQEMMNSLHPRYNLYVFHVVTALSCLMIRNAYSSSTLDLIRTNISKRYMTSRDYMIISITTDDRKRKWCLRRFGNQAFELFLSIWWKKFNNDDKIDLEIQSYCITKVNIYHLQYYMSKSKSRKSYWKKKFKIKS